MDSCIFCRIIEGKLPCYKVYEDDRFLAFLDIRPLNPGNSLLIPKKHYRWVYDVKDFAEYWQVARKIALATMKVLGAHSINFLTLGYMVSHAHIRIIPRFKNDGHTNGIKLSAVKKIAQKEMEEIASLLFKELKKS